MGVAVLLTLATLGQAGPLVFAIDADGFAKAPHRVELPPKWRFHPGDDPRWAARDIDESDWKDADPRLFSDSIPEDLDRVGWFRLRVELPPESIAKPMMFAFQRLGALEVYIDGRRVAELGDTQSVLQGGTTEIGLLGEPVLVQLNRPDPQLAIRFASPDVRAITRSGWPGGFFTHVGPATHAVQGRMHEVLDVARTYYLFIGVSLALGLLHLLLFAFLPSQRTHLYYALSTFAVASLSGCIIVRNFQVEFETFLWCNQGFSQSLAMLAIFGVMFLRTVVGLPNNRLLTGYYLLGAVLAIFAWWVPVPVFYSYAIVGLLEEVRVVIVGLQRKLRDLWVIAAGLVMSSTLSMVQMLPTLLGLKEMWWEDAYIYGFLALLLSMSIYLARNFARTHENLAHKLIEVRELSEATLEQERRAKSEEMQRVILEEENKRQALELEEAKERQRMMDELAATNRELHETQSQLVQSEKMASLGQLVAGIAHEINTPIGAVHSMHDSLDKATKKLQAILHKSAPELIEGNRKLKATLTVIEDATKVVGSGSERVATIVRRLKTFARLDEADLQRANLEEGLDDTLVLLRHELKHGVTVEKDYAGLPEIDCYPGQLNQVFLNLLVNAKQALSEAGKIEVRTRDLGSHVEVSITDDGVGIPPENLSRIFDPGFTTKGVKVGTGLGLSICYRIVQDHHGALSVDSAVGRGSTFTVRLPRDWPEDGAD